MPGLVRKVCSPCNCPFERRPLRGKRGCFHDLLVMIPTSRSDGRDAVLCNLA